MSFNIQDFQAQVGNRGYGVTNLFTVQISAPAGGFSQRDLVFYARSATLPEFEVSTQDIAHAGFGSATRKPTNIQFPIVPITFLVDSDHKILGFFHDWLKKIVNWDRSGGPSASSNGMMPFEVGYKSDYQGAMTITVYSRFNGREAYQYELAGVYPVSMGSVSTAWDSDDLMLLPVGFTFDVVKVSGVGTPTVTGGGDANSLLTYFSSLNTTVQAFKTFESRTEIQSIIDQSAATLDQIF